MNSNYAGSSKVVKKIGFIKMQQFIENLP